MKIKNSKLILRFALLSCILVFAFCIIQTAEAATLYFSPSSGSYNANQTFQVNVLVSSADQPVNAYSGTISFTQQNIEVVSILQTGSIVNFWAQNPSFSNANGGINFEGVTFNPGFQGQGGRVITITFKAKAAGTAVLTLTESAVLAADGLGTNVLKTTSGAEYNITLSTAPPTSPSSPVIPEEKPGQESTSTETPILPPDVRITKIPSDIRIGDILILEGETEPETIIRIYIQKLGEEAVLKKMTSDSEGKFVLQYCENLSEGNYLVWAQAEKNEEILGNPTKKYSLKVSLPPFLQFGKIALDYRTTIIALIVLIIAAIAIIGYTWYRIALWRKRLRKETKEASKRVISAFKNLQQEAEKQIEFLDRKPGLNKDEKQVRDKLKDALNISEESISKEIKDVEKELKKL